MNRNHPYFNQMVPAAPTPKHNNIDEFLSDYGYVPKVVNMKHPVWNDNHKEIGVFEWLFNQNIYNKNNGYIIDDQAYVFNPVTGDEAFAGAISAMVLSTDDENNVVSASTHIINTEDAGLRYVHYSQSGRVLDLGPIEHACLVGNTERPEGLYVPCCNTRAMADGIMFLENAIKEATLNDKDLPPFGERIEDRHECTCGGNCKCK